MNLSSRVQSRYLTRSLRSLVRYRVEHSKINLISPRAHVLFSIYCKVADMFTFFYVPTIKSFAETTDHVSRTE